ncbi:nuclear transport factor 2 family protein [Isoptericola sp. QY 916]|uniref:nuclear transport factor 2 family protein n=1 Tax=Isoptericola sp. QY 916 TaxID=2782570 RepID=UPI003D2FC339|nr:nuclear transport factor 2 family protein [Isoptericola sp. QY 916]
MGGDDEPGASAAFAALLRDWGAAIVANDAPAIDRFLDPGWTLVGTDGAVQDRAGFLGLVASGELVHTRMSAELVSVRVHDGVAVTLARGVSAGAWCGAPFRDEEWSVDRFVRQGSGWRCVHTVVVPASR